MGRPPEPHGAPAPVGTAAAGGTTGVPGPVPGLVDWTAWPRWALVAVAVATGVLAVSCLLCALCCCRRRRRRRKPGDQEAVGLGSARSSTTTHLVQPEVDGGESGPGGAPQWGRLQLSLEYDSGSQEVRVGLKQAADLRARGPGRTADPYARVSLSPRAGRAHETKVHHGTLCPLFDETCCFPVPPQDLPRTTLRVQVLDFRRFSRHEPLGELRLPLGTAGLPHVLELWHQLGPPGAVEAEPAGELCISLRYVPSAGRLTVVVLEARGLSPGLAEPYVKLQLARSRRKWTSRKTSARGGTAAPYFNEAFTFLVPVSQIQVGCPQGRAGGRSSGAKLTAACVLPLRPSACPCPERGPGAGRLGSGPAAPGRARGQGGAGCPGLWPAPAALGGHADPRPAAHRPVAPPAAPRGGGRGSGPAAPSAPALARLLKAPRHPSSPRLTCRRLSGPPWGHRNKCSLPPRLASCPSCALGDTVRWGPPPRGEASSPHLSRP
ncbi:synaptotagmin-8 isoform X2 [Phyllostomus discolor]|nr:synaptotagmin-8 isoform X2 [Phyllostomus discolor]